jgi:hypothetical protein
MCLRRAPEKYIAGAALDRADLGHQGLFQNPHLLIAVEGRKFVNQLK